VGAAAASDVTFPAGHRIFETGLIARAVTNVDGF
jgi:hypothetical protein